MGDFAATVNVYYEDGSLLTTGATVGDDVVVNNAISDNTNWAVGSVGYRFIEVKNTGTINLNSYLNLGFDCENFNCSNEDVTDSFYLRVTDISSQVKNIAESGNKLSKYIKNYVQADASAIQKTGKSFTESTKAANLGTTVGGASSYYLVEYCCYDLSPLVFDSNSYLSIGAKIRVQQSAAPLVADDEEVITGNGKVTKLNNKDNKDNNVDPAGNNTEGQENTTVPVTTNENSNGTDNNYKPESTTTVNIQDYTTPQPTTNNVVNNTTVPATEPVTQPATTEPTQPIGQWKYEYIGNNNSACRIINYNGSDKNINVPNVLDGAVVEAIDGYAFENSNAESITIPATVKNIRLGSLNVESLKKIEFEKTAKVNGVEYTSPYFADGLTVYSADKTMLIKYLPQNDSKVFKVNDRTDTICDNAFDGASLKELDLGAVKSISSSAFDNAKIESYQLHTFEPPLLSDDETFGAVSTVIGEKGEEYGTNVKIHIPEKCKENYENSYGFADYAKAKAIKTDGVLGSGTVGKVNVDGIEYTVIKNGSEYSGVRYNLNDEKYLAVVTGCNQIDDNGVADIQANVIFKEKDKDNTKAVESYVCPVVGIADYAFENAKDLKMVVLPNKDVYYTSNAFAGCDNLGLIDYDSVVPFDVGKFDAILNDIKIISTDDDENEG